MGNSFNESETNTQAPGVATEAVVFEADPLKLDLPDKDVVEVIDYLITESRTHFKKSDLYGRRKDNETYYLGKQTKQMEEEHKLTSHNARYQDNVIYEAEGTLKAVAVSRVPDLIVYPSSDTPEREEMAEVLTEIVNSRIKKRENRSVLGMAYRHRPIYFTAVVKARWDSEKGKYGDYKYENIHPDNIDVDHTVSGNNPDDMNWIAHHYEMTVKEIVMKWPNKKEALLKMLGWKDESEKKLASKIKISEVWFTWYSKKEDKFVRDEGVIWKYKTLVFDKIKNPYWDWEGEEALFKYNNELGKKERVQESDIRQSLMGGTGLGPVATGKIYHNHFDDPKKPFFFFGYDQLGMGPFDETTRLEQSKYLQDNINLRGKQISEITSRSRGKDVFSTKGGMTASSIQKLDPTNPDQSVLVDGFLRDVYTHIPGEQPSSALFQEQAQNRERLFSKMGTNSALRGLRGGEDTATQTQLFKESDFTRIDDEVEETINACAEWMADWAMQFIKLFYIEEHFEKIEGQAGKVIHQKITRDYVEDGMEAKVSASSVDKMRRKREAFELANIKMIDPINFFKSIEDTDPEGKAEALMLFNMTPDLYVQKYIKGNETTEQMAGALQEQNVADLGATGVPPEAIQGPPPLGV